VDELLDYIYNAYTCELLEEAESESGEIELQELDNEISSILNDDSGNQTRRNKGRNSGTVIPTETGPRKVRTNTATTLGEYIAGDSNGRRRKKLHHDFQYLHGTTLCEVKDYKKSQIVILNLNNDYIRAKREEKDSQSLASQAIGAYAAYKAACMLTFAEGSFLDAYLRPYFEKYGEEIHYAHMRFKESAAV